MILLFKNLLFTIVIPGTVAVYLPLYLAGKEMIQPGAAFILGVVFLVLGGLMYTWCIWNFATFGRGTPAPIDAPKSLVIRGPYRYVRNPMYVGVLTVILGWTVLYKNPRLFLYMSFVALIFHLFIVLYEEPHLRSVFGNEYENYCTRVGRWLPRNIRRT